FNDGPREMTKTVCSDCGKECEVPFKPTEGRPVYCQECLPKHRTPRNRF
ncbi:MAG TPA: DNA-directed RNA polymerase, partial [Methanocorpusculum sp.]|nr:DNA-directed RNA polymerase [Methanocorpusculum sp.]